MEMSEGVDAAVALKKGRLAEAEAAAAAPPPPQGFLQLADEAERGDLFSVEDLLVFDDGAETDGGGEVSSKADAFEGDSNGHHHGYPSATAVSVPLPVSLGDDIDLPPTPDDAAEFEWMSSIIDDSGVPEYPPACRPAAAKPEPRVQLSTFCATTKAKRSKRPRSSTSSSSSSPSSSSSSSSSSSPPPPPYAYSFHSHAPTALDRMPKKHKKRGRKPVLNRSSQRGGTAGIRCSGGGGGGGGGERRCTHCGSQKTPQWRTGPTGPKTLCNACGVRYKSGRLVPEYRPAASPTFVSHVHSNSHRKVLEMRRKKEAQLLAPPVESF